MSKRRLPGSFTEDTPPDLEDELEEEMFDDDETAEETTEIALAEEPLFSWLLRQAVFKTSPNDVVLQDYVTHVTPALSEHLALKTAKGGEDFIAARLAEGKSTADVARYRLDQSLRAHLVNGLLPTVHVARLLNNWEAPRFFAWNEQVYRLFCAGFTLHDWVKLPEMEAELATRGLQHDKANPALHLVDFEEIFRQWGVQLGLDSFLAPIGGLENWLHDVIYLAVNTQRRWGTMLNLSALPNVQLNGRAQQLATDLCTLADYLAYIAKTPVALATHNTITSLIYNLSGGEAQLLYHHVSENRGVLTNFIHNAAMTALQTEACVPLLYAPSGTVYLARQPMPIFPDVTDVAEATIRRIREACGKRLMTQFVGFSRAGKGLKAAPYYDLHLSIPDQIRLTARAVFKQIPESKKGVFSKRLEKITDKGWLDRPLNLDELDDTDIRVDQLAEFAAYVTILAQTAVPKLNAAAYLLKQLDISTIQPTFAALQSAPNTGGTPYHWYYAAAYYTQYKGQGKDPNQWRTLLESVAESLARAVEQAQNEQQTGTQADGWDDLRHYITQTLTFGPVAAEVVDVSQLVMAELLRYQGAKRKGRKATAVCSLCSSAFTINPQREAGILFAPQVYTNKQPLHGTKAIRNICQLCETEMMLRQILMNRGGSIGGRFEGRKFRYLYLYPAYFFTPETAAQVSQLYHTLKSLSFSSIRKLLLTEGKDEIKLDIATLQRLQDLMLTPEPPEEDRLFRLHFPENDPISLFFLGMPPPGRDAKDAEAWINPAFLALLLPVVLDVKVVTTESPIPLLHEADELDETVFFDAPHHYVNDIVGYGRLPLDRLLTRLRGLIVVYMIHLDGNAKLNQGEYRWHAIPPLARNLSSNSLWASAYLKKWQRAQSSDSIPIDQARLYQQYIEVLDELFIHQGGVRMSHARQLTKLYRQFYRHKRRNSNSYLRPITIASRAILDADPRLFSDKESLIEVVYGEVRGFMDRVTNGSADGRLSPRINDETPAEAMNRRFAAMKSFAEYFVGTIYFDVLGGDMAALRGKQLNLLKNTCEIIYLDAEAVHWQERNAALEEQEEETHES